MFCPNCGVEIKKKIKWKVIVPSLSIGEAEVKCPGCKASFSLLDQSTQDQENRTEIIFH